jgi:amino acid transporter
MNSTKPSAFVREATGLVKNVSFFEAVSLTLIWMSIVPGLGSLGFSTILLPTMVGANIIVASILSVLIVIPQNVVYTIMSRRMSRTGGDYVWLSRALPPAFSSALSFAGMTLETIPYIALIALSTVFAIGSVGLALGYSGALGLALSGGTPGAEPGYQFLIAALIMAVLVGINMVRPKAGYRLVAALWVLGIIGIILGVGVLLIRGNQGVIGYINSLGVSGLTYQKIQSSYSGPEFSWVATLSLLPFFALFAYPWFQAAPAVGSELKQKAARLTVPVGLALAFAEFTVPLAAMYYVGGYHFINMALTNSTLVYNYSFGFWTLAMGVSGNIVLSWIIGLAWVAGSVGVVAFGVILISRYLLAQSFDRFLPARLSYVSPRFGSPVNAQLVVLVLGVAIAGAAAFLYGTFVSLYGVLVASMIYFAFVGIAAVRHGLKTQPGSERSALIVAGVLQALAFFYLTYQFVSGGSIWGGNPLAYGYIVVAFITGLLIFYASKRYNASKGIDITLAFKEIPPE